MWDKLYDPGDPAGNIYIHRYICIERERANVQWAGRGQEVTTGGGLAEVNIDNMHS